MKRLKDFQNLKGGCTISTSSFYAFLYGFISYCAPKKIIEIGTNFGLSSIAMALALEDNNVNGHIYTCDITFQCLSIAQKQIEKMKLQDKITLINGTSDTINKKEHFDLGFIDGDHSYEGAKKDFKNLKDKCNIILLHDIHKREVATVLKENGGNKVCIYSSPNSEGTGIWKNEKI